MPCILNPKRKPHSSFELGPKLIPRQVHGTGDEPAWKHHSDRVWDLARRYRRMYCCVVHRCFLRNGIRSCWRRSLRRRICRRGYQGLVLLGTSAIYPQKHEWCCQAEPRTDKYVQRSDIPTAVTRDASEIDTSTLGTPDAEFLSSGCSITGSFTREYTHSSLSSHHRTDDTSSNARDRYHSMRRLGRRPVYPR